MTHTGEVNGQPCGGKVERIVVPLCYDDSDVGECHFTCEYCGPVPESEVGNGPI